MFMILLWCKKTDAISYSSDKKVVLKKSCCNRLAEESFFFLQDYALIVPAEQHGRGDLELLPIDKSGDFLTMCVNEGFELK